MFKTIEEANEYKLEMEEKYKSLELAKQGMESKFTNEKTELEKKLEEVNSLVKNSEQEIERLKIKNYEYFEKLTTSNKIDDNFNHNVDKEKEIEIPSIDDIINDFR